MSVVHKKNLMNKRKYAYTILNFKIEIYDNDSIDKEFRWGHQMYFGVKLDAMKECFCKCFLLGFWVGVFFCFGGGFGVGYFFLQVVVPVARTNFVSL